MKISCCLKVGKVFTMCTFQHVFGKRLQMVVFKKPGSVCQPVASHNGVLWTMQQAGNLQSDDI